MKICLLGGVFVCNMLSAQSIITSVPEKFSSKYSDYEIIGKNELGVVVHHYNEGVNHQLVVYSDHLTPKNKISINVDEKNTELQEVVLLPSYIAIFYRQVNNGYVYLKAKKISADLNLPASSILMDSVKKDGVEITEPFFIKTSPDHSKILTFNLQESRNEKLNIYYSVYSSNFELIERKNIFIDDKYGIQLKAARIANNGNVIFLAAHASRRENDEKYAIAKFSLITSDVHSKEAPLVNTIEQPGYIFKQPAVDMSLDGSKVFLSGCYKEESNEKNLGLFASSFDFRGSKGFFTKIPLKEEDVIQIQSFEFRNWEDRASIIRPKNIIPRNDGGFILVNESEYKYTKVVRTPTPSNFSSNTFPYYNQDQYVKYYDQNHYYDLFAISIQSDGNIDWKAIMPKVQETESDGGLFSSYFLFESDNILKFLFNEDIYNNGNFMEYNLNANGHFKRVSILNSEKKDLQLIPQKALQIDGNTAIIPSERKRYLQLVMFKY